MHYVVVVGVRVGVVVGVAVGTGVSVGAIVSVGVGGTGVELGGTGVFVGVLVLVGAGVAVSVTSGGEVGDAVGEIVGVRVGGRVKRDVGDGEGLVTVGDILASDAALTSAALTVFLFEIQPHSFEMRFCFLSSG